MDQLMLKAMEELRRAMWQLSKDVQALREEMQGLNRNLGCTDPEIDELEEIVKQYKGKVT
jgi:prefoldin subunit 5